MHLEIRKNGKPVTSYSAGTVANVMQQTENPLDYYPDLSYTTASAIEAISQSDIRRQTFQPLYPDECYEIPLKLIHIIGANAFDEWVKDTPPAHQHIFELLHAFNVTEHTYETVLKNHPNLDAEQILAMNK
jgi:hypothetical protein